MSLLFNMLSRFVIAFLLRSKHLLISQLRSLSAVIKEPKKIKSITVSTFSPSICHEVMGLYAMILVFWMLSFKLAFSLYFILIKKLFSCSLFSAIRVVSFFLFKWLKLGHFQRFALAPSSAGGRAKEQNWRTVDLFFSKWCTSGTYTFTHILLLTTWPHLALRETRKCGL